MKNLTFQGIFELQTNLEGKVLTSHTCLRYSKGAPGSHNSSAHRIMYIRRVERYIFQFGASPPPRRALFWGETVPMVSGPETTFIRNLMRARARSCVCHCNTRKFSKNIEDFSCETIIVTV